MASSSTGDKLPSMSPVGSSVVLCVSDACWVVLGEAVTSSSTGGKPPPTSPVVGDAVCVCVCVCTVRHFFLPGRSLGGISPWDPPGGSPREIFLPGIIPGMFLPGIIPGMFLPRRIPGRYSSQGSPREKHPWDNPQDVSSPGDPWEEYLPGRYSLGDPREIFIPGR